MTKCKLPSLVTEDDGIVVAVPLEQAGQNSPAAKAARPSIPLDRQPNAPTPGAIGQTKTELSAEPDPRPRAEKSHAQKPR
jgi:hypothetical protein